jgi:hypothetical protein
MLSVHEVFQAGPYLTKQDRMCLLFRVDCFIESATAYQQQLQGDAADFLRVSLYGAGIKQARRGGGEI